MDDLNRYCDQLTGFTYLGSSALERLLPADFISIGYARLKRKDWQLVAENNFSTNTYCTFIRVPRANRLANQRRFPCRPLASFCDLMNQALSRLLVSKTTTSRCVRSRDVHSFCFFPTAVVLAHSCCLLPC